MSGSDGSGADSGGIASALQNAFSSGPGAGNNAAGASQFAMPGGTASQFMMPGGNIPQYQGGASMMPAALGGAQGVSDAQNFTQAVQNAGGMTPANWQQVGQQLGAGAAGMGKLQAPQTPHMPMVQGGARAANMGNMNFIPQQMSLLQPALGAQGGGVNSLLSMLAGANAGFKV
jgi:hypothetical protein